MFFEGTLQEGINTALQQSKLVVCFVTDGGSESQRWETEFLVDDAIREPLSNKAVILKLQAGTTEAGYLAAIFPLPKTPTLVIMNKGELKEYIAAGVSKEDFVSRTARALGTTSQQQPPATAATPRAAATPSTAPAPAPSPASAPLTQPSSSPTPQTANSTISPAASSPSTTTGTTFQPQPSPQVQSLLSERAARLEAQRAEQERKRAEQRRKDKGKAPESSSSGAASPSSSKPKDPAQAKYSRELKQRQQQARDDRARVLQAIEDDKAARRARAAERQAERGGLAAAAGYGGAFSELPGRVKERDGGEDDRVKCKLQIRLFDGSTVKGEWKGSDSLGEQVRAWLAEQQGSMKGVGEAYAFKVILTPRPNRTIDVGEEGKSLRELGLAPSATLVLVPAAGKEYPQAVGGNPVTRMLMMIVGVFTGLWALLARFLGAMFKTAPAPSQVQGRETGASGWTSGRDQSRKAGLRQLRRDAERKDEQQFYNGNSTNFEPRKDDDDEQQG